MGAEPAQLASNQICAGQTRLHPGNAYLRALREARRRGSTVRVGSAAARPPCSGAFIDPCRPGRRRYCMPERC
ncbi:MAG TPA: CGNR zinc finger domain-containing protein [Pseudonocardia sp.]|nr:CGNR zinc finger domain-containing protein [Pseudonocardia sp.]